MTAIARYGSGFFWTVVAGIGTLAGVILTLLTLVIPWIFSRRVITYELRTVAPLIHMPLEVDPDLQVAYHGRPLQDPHVIAARLAYRGRKDLLSTDFDQDGPLNLDVGVEITAFFAANSLLQERTFPRCELTARRSKSALASSAGGWKWNS